MESKKYTNNHGTVTLRPISKCMAISKISYANTVEVADNLLSLFEMEKIGSPLS